MAFFCDLFISSLFIKNKVYCCIFTHLRCSRTISRYTKLQSWRQRLHGTIQRRKWLTTYSKMDGGKIEMIDKMIDLPTRLIKVLGFQLYFKRLASPLLFFISFSSFSLSLSLQSKTIDFRLFLKKQHQI